jgi:uncharacterized membrane protein YfcA
MPIDHISSDLALWSAAILGLAFFIRGIAGFGSGLVAIPLLALFLPLTVVVPAIALLDYAAAAMHGIHHRERIVWRDLLPLLPFTLAGSLTALYLLHRVDTAYLNNALGAFILVYALYSLSGIAPHQRHSRGWAIPFGGIGGLISTLFGTGGPFYVIYLHLRALDKQAFRATVAAIFMIDGAIRIAGYAVTGLVGGDILLLVLAGLPVMLLAMYAGGHVHTSISQRAFSRLISLLLVGSGLALLLR